MKDSSSPWAIAGGYGNSVAETAAEQVAPAGGLAAVTADDG